MRTHRLFPLFGRIRKSSKYHAQGTDEKRRARLFPVDGINAGYSDGYIYGLNSNRYRAEDLDLFTWTAKGGLTSLAGKAIPAKDRLILEFDAVCALMSREERQQVEAAQLKTVSEFLAHARELLLARDRGAVQSGDQLVEVEEEETDHRRDAESAEPEEVAS